MIPFRLFHDSAALSLDCLLDCCVDVVLDVVLGVEDVDGEGAARDGEAGHVPEKVGELLRVHRRRRHDQLQVGTTRNHRSAVGSVLEFCPVMLILAQNVVDQPHMTSGKCW